jgi:hypothetical protein
MSAADNVLAVRPSAQRSGLIMMASVAAAGLSGFHVHMDTSSSLHTCLHWLKKDPNLIFL